MPFEAVIYTTSGEDPKDVSFVRITDVNVVLRKMIDELVSSKLFTSLPNIPNQELYLLLSGDKGGNSTKLMLQILNTKSSQSVRTAKLIGIFEGEKDNHECVEAIFGSVIEEIQEFAHKIESFHLKCLFSLHPNLSSTSTGKESTRTEFLNLNGTCTSNIPDQLGKLDNENMYASPNCVLCNHDHNSSGDAANSHNAPMSTAAPTTETTEESNEFNQCLLVLGVHDWQWIANILGCTGANGVYFCKDCLCRIADISKRKMHTPFPLEKYSDYIPEQTEFEKRTFEMLKENSAKFIANGSVK